MSLRSDVWFVTTLIGKSLRQILGETLRTLADYLLHEEKVVTTPEPIKVQKETSPTPIRTPRPKGPYKPRARLEVIGNDPPPEVSEGPEKPARVRDRSGYNPKDHNGYKIAAVGVLRTLLDNDTKFSAPALHKVHQNISDSTIRTACKTMVDDGLLATELDKGINSAVYWILDREGAHKHLMELEAVAPKLPTSNEAGES